MEENINTLLKIIEDLNKESKFKDIIALLSDEVLRKEKNNASELHTWRGYIWYDIKEYDKAFTDFSKAIEIDPNYALAFYNRGLVWVIKGDYDKAIADYSKAIEFTTDYADFYYNDRGMAWKAKEEYDKAIDDYTKAIEINPLFENAYYNRGLAKKEKDDKPKEIRSDFEKYLELTNYENEVWARYAKHYIKVLDDLIEDPKLLPIKILINNIKKTLLIEEECITHYSSLSALKSLIFDKSKFRISEGNFMNDPSEGTEFFNFMEYKPDTSCDNGFISEDFSPKPFIGSFVTKDKYDDLNMWRFYGKEKGIEAKGCSITLCKQEFIDDIKNFLSNEVKEARQDNESEIIFYRVAYKAHGTTNFNIPDSDKNKELMYLMTKLKEEVESYKVKNKTSLEKHLNSIAFLFKSDAYKNENEVRLVLNGIEFEKKYIMDATPPRVYIELESIKKSVKQITLGPKVDKVNEWASAFHYSYELNAPEIVISRLPYK